MARLVKKFKREILTLGLILIAVLAYKGIQYVYADAMENEKDVLSTSAPTTTANHEIWAKKTTTWAVDDTLVVEIDEDGTAFNLTGIDYTDIDLSYGVNGTETEAVLFTAAGASTWKVEVNTTTDKITFITPSSLLIPAQNDKVKIEIGTNAIGGVANAQITNPAKVLGPGIADIYKIYYTYDDGGGGAAEDTGRAMVAIIEGVTVSATVAESLSFSITNVASGDCDTTFGNLADATVSNTSVDFGTLTISTFTHGCQDLGIGTNAGNGYTITSQESDQLFNGVSTIVDTPCDGGPCTESSANPWVGPANYGFGHTCSTIDGTGCNTAYSTGNSYRQFASIADAETAQAIMTKGSVPTVVTEKGRVEYKITVGATQQAGIYNNTITYIATPNF